MAPIPTGDTLRDRLTRMETMQKEILRRMDSLPTPERCATEEGRIKAIENDIAENIKPEITDLYRKHEWIMRTSLVSLGSALVSLVIATFGLIAAAWKGGLIAK